MDELFRLWREHERLIEEVIWKVASRRDLPSDDREDFAQDVRLRFIDPERSPLLRRDGRGGASWETFFHIVINRIALDRIVKEQGKCRPSAAARGMGRWAIRLEKLIVCRRYPVREAVALVVSESKRASPDGESLTERKVYEMCGRLPIRYGRELVTLDPDDGVAPWEVVGANPAGWIDVEEAAAMREALTQALEGLDTEDQLIIRLRFFDGFTLARVGEEVGLSPQRIHDRVKRVLTRLRDRLREQGIGDGDGEDR